MSTRGARGSGGLGAMYKRQVKPWDHNDIVLTASITGLEAVNTISLWPHVFTHGYAQGSWRGDIGAELGGVPRSGVTGLRAGPCLLYTSDAGDEE